MVREQSEQVLRSIGARWLFDGLGCLYEHALLKWAGERIVAVEPGHGHQAERYFDQAVILPGLVNAHTHLDLSDLRAEELPREPCAWLSRVIEHRRRASQESLAQAVRLGVHESLRHGVTLVGDIAVTATTLEVLAESPVRATVFIEVVGLAKPRARSTWHSARLLVQTWPNSAQWRLGLSPHAPYSTRRSLFRLAARSQWPMAIHLAEFVEEHALLQERTGPFRTWLASLGVWDNYGLVGSYEELMDWLEPAGKILFVHLNYPNDALLERLTAWSSLGKVCVVYCPRTHEYFAHAPHPWLDLMTRGIPVVLGTDSRASNPDLSLLSELRFLRQRGCPLSAVQLLRLVTSQAAQFLGWSETGSLLSGQLADFLVVPLPASDAADPLRLLLETDTLPTRVYINGRPVHVAD